MKRTIHDKKMGVFTVKPILRIMGAVLLSLLVGCAPVLIGTGATGAYKVSTDERTAGGIVDDAALSTEVKARLIDEPAVRARNIDVDVLEGIVTLTGMVETQEEATRAFQTAAAVPGVRSVKNDLQIGSRTAGQVIDDTILGNRIKAKLISEPGVRSLNIDVDVYGGVVSLSGIVAGADLKRKIIDIARETPGTRRVIDNIIVKAP
ncbi:MAG: BON domain-containing protein [Deltaproteobacteria bacterium]|nr:BON domain-containing protein [Deltaproteobacteria bacterium]